VASSCRRSWCPDASSASGPARRCPVTTPQPGNRAWSQRIRPDRPRTARINPFRVRPLNRLI
jgi:hypothetical protein